MSNKPIFTILPTTNSDIDFIFHLFDNVIQLQRNSAYKVWEGIDREALIRDIENRLQYKIIVDDSILCVFSLQLSDPFIWGAKDQNDAIYLHRIVANPDSPVKRLFSKVLDWVLDYAKKHQLKYIRMDTWAENTQLINYYKSYGFSFVENFKTGNNIELPIQNRNLNVALLQLEVNSINIIRIFNNNNNL